MNATFIEFDHPHYQHINDVRAAWLHEVLNELPQRDQLSTALDVGCGAGYFTNLLHEHGLSAAGVDLRQENIDLCRQRYPYLDFATVDLDHDFSLPHADIVLMFGILYHLQSPLTAIPRLAQSIGHVGIVSTRVAAGTQSALYLFHENQGRAHNGAAVTAVPTLPALIALFYLSGLEYCYEPRRQPEHAEWHGSTQTNGKRHSFLVSRQPLSVGGWRRLRPGTFLNKWQPIA